jgi:glycosyltransferase involved in cell wall biosynthesis
VVTLNIPTEEPGKQHLAFLLPDLKGGGAERVALTLIKDFLARGHRVDLLVLNARGELLPLLPDAVQLIDLKAKRIRSAIPSIASYLRREKPDGIQVSMWSLTIAGILAHRLSGSPARLVVSDHAAMSKQYENSGWLRRTFLKWSIRLLYPLADARIVVAQATADDLARLSGLPRRAFEVVYNPVYPPQSKVDPALGVDELWGGSSHRILNVGRMTAEKNQMLLLDAFARISGDARLIILGEGELRGELEAHAAKLGIADRVVMPGFVIDPTPFYRSADLFVLSSDYEGFGLVLVEAMRSGLPIVSTDCASGPAEILADGRFGRLAPCGDAERLAAAMLEELAAPTDPEQLKARAEELSGAHIADRYLELMGSGWR